LLGGILIGPSFLDIYSLISSGFFQDPKLTDAGKNAIKSITAEFPTLRPAPVRCGLMLFNV
jgi:hypothetical protein